MSKILCIFAVILASNGQVIQFGTCPEVETMQFFDVERFLGQWFEISRFPAWFEENGACAYKYIHYCGRRVQIEHVFVRDNIQYVLHVNSTYNPGDKAVFVVEENKVDPVGIPLSVISTDYTDYAVVYGCKNQLMDETNLIYMTAWILSREPALSEHLLIKAIAELNHIPNANVAYLNTVEQKPEKCLYYWTAHVQAESSKSVSLYGDLKDV